MEKKFILTNEKFHYYAGSSEEDGSPIISISRDGYENAHVFDSVENARTINNFLLGGSFLIREFIQTPTYNKLASNTKTWN